MDHPKDYPVDLDQDLTGREYVRSQQATMAVLAAAKMTAEASAVALDHANCAVSANRALRDHVSQSVPSRAVPTPEQRLQAVVVANGDVHIAREIADYLANG